MLRHPVDCEKVWFHAEIVSAVIEWGSYPFPSRTRKLSLRSPMVPGPRARESRSPLDSRPLRGKPRRGLFFCLSPRPPCRGRPTQNPSQKRFPSRCHPAPVAGPACTVSIADTVPLAEVSLITDTFPPAIVIPAPVPGPAYTIPHCRYVSPRGNVTHYRYSSYCRYDLPCVPNPYNLTPNP